MDLGPSEWALGRYADDLGCGARTQKTEQTETDGECRADEGENFCHVRSNARH